MQKLGIGEGIVRIDRSDCDFNLTVPLPEVEDEADKRREEVKAASRATYGTPRVEVEAMLLAAWESGVAEAEPVKKETVPKKSTLRKPASEASPSAPPETPKPVDLPKFTDSEKEKVVVAVKPVVVESPKPLVIREPQTPRDQGKGGEQHKAIQRRIKDAAEALGFRSVIEKQLASSAQSIDLFLERGDQQIACEISISTTIDHEVGNVRKCLEAGIPKVAVICLETERLRKIATAVSGSLGPDAAKRVVYLEPDQFIADLKQIPLPMPAAASEKTVVRRGYKVKRSLPQLTFAEQKQREDVTNRVLSEATGRSLR